ncbi:unnamed protein product [Rotaria sordida]|uniref:SAM domain-containing protein n=2 Tax=Rotaria sordida TaxID=392033 RepID=A0A815QM56_9BILA|nr:unnamed protein product [Rotaria sordida]CAF4098352.1 unnamed protein product [Rotaria sordida]
MESISIYLDDSTIEEVHNDLPFSQKINHRQRINGLSLPEKKRQRSDSCKYAQLIDKRLKSSSSDEDIEITIPNAATRTTSFNNLNSHKNDCSSFINANQHIPSYAFGSFHQHFSLLNNAIENQENISLHDSQFSSISFRATSTPLPTLNTSTTRRAANIIRADLSPIKYFNQKSNNHIIIYKKDGFVPCENRQTFTIEHNDINFKKVNISNAEEDTNNDLPVDPNVWTITQVGKFIRRLTNDIVAQVFLASDIDGKAFLLLTKDDLLYDMKIKFGPAKNILNEITNLCKRVQTFF